MRATSATKNDYPATRAAARTPATTGKRGVWASARQRLSAHRGFAIGLVFTGLLACSSIRLSGMLWLQGSGVSALTLAIVLGMLVGNTLPPGFWVHGAAGVDFAKKTLLRAGIVLYGLRLTFQDIGGVGVGGVALDALVLTSTFAWAWLLGVRVLGLDRRLAMLIGAGSSICGAAAVMATEPVVRGRADQVAVAVSTVVVFGTLGMFLYPALYSLGVRHGWLTMSPAAFGIWVGATIHEVAQVVVAGNAIGAQAADTAVIVKMVRVMMLAPFLLALSAWLARSNDAGPAQAQASGKGRIVIPWFALGFVAVAGLNSVVAFPKPWLAVALDIDTALLATAMAALGLTTHLRAIRSAGIKPLALAALLFVWLLIGGFALQASVQALWD
jgi:uncharacterized integral membrane protein (TIGR00698 family)